MFEELLQLPLFQGITADQLILFAGRFPLHFETLSPKVVLVKEKEVSEELFFIINGRIRKRIVMPGTKLVLSEEINSPFAIPPVSFYGKRTDSIAQWETVTETRILRVRKKDYLKMLHSNSVMILSLITMLANQAQMSTHFALNHSLKDLKSRFAFWVLNLTHKETDLITITGSRSDLITILGTSNLTIKTLCEELEDAQVIECRDREIWIRDRSKIEDLL